MLFSINFFKIARTILKNRIVQVSKVQKENILNRINKKNIFLSLIVSIITGATIALSFFYFLASYLILLF